MVALALTLLRYLWPVILFGFLYLWADEGWHNAVAKRAESQLAHTSAQLQQAQEELTAARKRASDLALLWDQKRQAAETAIAERDKEREQRQSDAVAAAKKLSAAVAAVRVPAPAVVVLNHAIAPSTIAPESPGKPDQGTGSASAGADSTVGLLTQWGVTVVGMYNACRDQVIGWIAFYSSLQAAQPKE